MKLSLRPAVFLLFVMLATGTHQAYADWPTDGLYINSLATPSSPFGSSYMRSLPFAPDGAGGIYMKWNFHLQRISPYGELLYDPDLPLGSEADCAADGAGGLFLADVVGVTLKLLRLDSAGSYMWISVVSATPYAKSSPRVSSDGVGGALVAWSEVRPLPRPDDAKTVYCQRVDGNGNVLWSPEGVFVRKQYGVVCFHDDCVAVGVNVSVTDVCEGAPGGVAGGALVVTYERQSDINFDYPLAVVNAVSSTGSLVGHIGTSAPPMFAIPDGAGGAYTSIMPVYGSYTDYSSEGYPPVHDQPVWRFSPDAAKLWTVTLGSWSEYRSGAAIARTTGGVVAVWVQDESDVYAQKISEFGAPLWGLSGVPVCTIAGAQTDAVVATDFVGGAHIAWSDARNGGKDIYMQHLDATGAPTLVGDQGNPVTSQEGDETHTTLYTDPAGYAIVAWNNVVVGGNYAQRVAITTVAVAISDFRARLRDGRVVLEAELQSDMQIHEVKIYRAVEEESFRLLESIDAPDARRLRYDDMQVVPGTRYRYQLAVSDADGEFLSQIVELTTPALTTSLKQNQPNPFNPETTISFTLEKTTRATVQIYSADGRHVRTLLDEERFAGSHRITWNGTDDSGQPVSSGIYFYRLTANKFSDTRKMVLLK